MSALAVQDDIAAELGRALTSAEIAKADAALDKASDYVRNETRRKWEAGTFTVRRRVRGGKVALDSPSTIDGVQSVDDLGGAADLAGYVLRGSTLYGLGYARWVEVTYTSAGDVPDDLRRVVAAMAARDITNEVPQGATSYSVTRGPFSEQTGFDEPTDSLSPTATEAETIRKYAMTRPRSLSIVP